MDPVLIAAGVLVLAVAMYVILDGFDLGVGILFPFAPGEAERDLMINSVAPFWDGNETWLVLGGVTLFAAFPLAYSILLPAWYLGIIFFLVALVFRGIVFEFRSDSHQKWLWMAPLQPDLPAPPSPRAWCWGVLWRGSNWSAASMPGGRSAG